LKSILEVDDFQRETAKQ